MQIRYKLLLLLSYLLFLSINVWGESKSCFLAVENPDQLEPKIIESLSVSLLSKYVETMKSIPQEGIGTEECLYQVSLKKSDSTILITISGPKLNGVGDSKLTGYDGVQQAFLAALFHGNREKRIELCQDFGEKLEKVCKEIDSADVATHRPPTFPRVTMPAKQMSGLMKGICSAPRARRDYRHCNFRKKKFRRLNLEGANFSGVNLEKADFDGCNLTGVNFKNSNLTKVKFSRSTLQGTDLSEANLSKTQFEGLHIKNVTFAKSNLQKADFKGAVLQNINFSGANLGKSQFARARLTLVDFTHANLSDAGFRRARLKQVNLTDANLADANFSKASMVNVIR